MNQQVLQKIQAKFGKQNPADLRAGDTIRVFERIHEKDKDRIQLFEGLVIATKHGRGLNGSFNVRKIAAGNIGVERVFPLHSPNIIKIERTKSARVNRSKIYYMRERFGKSAKLKHEFAHPAVWEEKGAEEEIEKIADLTAEAAEQAAEEKEEAEEVQEENRNQKIENSPEEKS